MSKEYNLIVKLASKDLCIPEDVIRNVYGSIWKFIKQDIAEHNVSANPHNNSYSIHKIGKLYSNEQTCKKYKYENNKDLTTK